MSRVIAKNPQKLKEQGIKITFQHTQRKIEFFSNGHPDTADKKVTKCQIIRRGETNEILAEGEASLNHKDQENSVIGRTVAFVRAVKNVADEDLRRVLKSNPTFRVDLPTYQTYLKHDH